VTGVEVFLDNTPGETRGIIVHDGRPEHLLIQREDDIAEHRLGARSVGRAARIEPGLKGAFVDLGVGEPLGFLPVRDGSVTEGARVEVETIAEPRGGKGPALRLVGEATGEARLISAGADVGERLAGLAPGVEIVTGLEAIHASRYAEEDALSAGVVIDNVGLDLKVERTRALVAIDLDWRPTATGRGGQARDRANARGLAEAARLMRLKAWGGLAAIDLIGAGHNGDAVTTAARRAFADTPDLVIGPVNRFGVLMLSLPWRRTPIEERLLDPDGAPSLRTRAQAVVRTLNEALLSDRGSACITARCASEEAALAAPWAARLGPRARLIADPALAQGQVVLETL
jgi:Ribonuclease G/E